MRKLLLISLFLFPTIALAGGSSPWCLVRDENEICKYNAAEECYEAVAKLGGSCRENHLRLGMRGENQWCVVTGSRRDCSFNMSRQCFNAAQKVGGGCVRNTEKALEYAKSSGEFVSGEGLAGDIARELELAGKGN